MSEFGIGVAWHNEEQRAMFLRAWGIETVPAWLHLQQDANREGGAKTKNKALKHAIESGAEVVISMDDDCYPATPGQTLEEFARLHIEALKPQPVRMFEAVTDPPSRGTPYDTLDIVMPVAASMGFWTEIGDYCGVRQLAFNAAPMTFKRETVFQRYFPLCAMNYAFRAAEWEPWCYLVENVGRFDDIWMGWMWQHEAYRRGQCFNLNGPLIRHARQSNVWKNLTNEVIHLEANETLWRKIATGPATTYEALRAMLPR